MTFSLHEWRHVLRNYVPKSWWSQSQTKRGNISPLLSFSFQSKMITFLGDTKILSVNNLYHILYDSNKIIKIRHYFVNLEKASSASITPALLESWNRFYKPGSRGATVVTHFIQWCKHPEPQVWDSVAFINMFPSDVHNSWRKIFLDNLTSCQAFVRQSRVHSMHRDACMYNRWIK